MWKVIYKQNGKWNGQLLTDKQKAIWENHPAVKNTFRYEEVEEEKKKAIQEPIEAKKYVDKTNQAGYGTIHSGGSGEPHATTSGVPRNSKKRGRRVETEGRTSKVTK